MIIKGLVVTVSDDLGPKAVINLSDVQDTVTFKLAMIGMTVLMLGNSDPNYFSKKCHKILGPIPVPLSSQEQLVSGEKNDISESDALAIIINVTADLPTKDLRVMEYGRFGIVWFLSDFENHEKIFSITKKIEIISVPFLRQVKFESQLTNKAIFQKLLLEIQSQTEQSDHLTYVETYRPEPIINAKYILYTYDFQKERIIPIQFLDEVKNLSVFIFIDIYNKQIHIIQQNQLHEKDLHIISKEVSNLNLALKHEFTVKIVYDQLEIDMYFEKIARLVDGILP